MLFTRCSQTTPIDTSIPYIDTGVDTDTWVTIPQGPFLIGQHEIETDVNYDYQIMVTDVTNTQYADFLNAALESAFIKVNDDVIVGTYPGDDFHGHKHEIEIKAGDWSYMPMKLPEARISFDGTRFNTVPSFENHPVTLVTWFGAWGYCQYYEWRLPTDIEWEKAARGTDNRPYPWGQEITPYHATFVSSHDILERTFKGAGGTTPVGFYNGQSYLTFKTIDGSSPFGLYDMAGNVWQWTGDIQEGVHYRNLRGGSHNNYAYNLRIWTHNNADPTHFSPSVGFRCARDN